MENDLDHSHLPSAAVVVPVYNRSHLVTRALDSIAAQDVPLHLIVVDNNSTDDTLDKVCGWAVDHRRPGLHIDVLSETIPGAAAARRRGAEAVSEEILFFFDSDDTMRPGLVRSVLEYFKSNPGCELAAWRINTHLLGGREKLSKAWRMCQLFDHHIVHSVLSTQCYACRTELHRRSGGWRDDVRVWDDWELGLRLALQPVKGVVFDKVMVDVFSQEESLTGTDFHSKAGMWEHAMDCAQRALEASSHPMRDYGMRLIWYRRAILAAFYRREGRAALASGLMKAAVAPAAKLRHRAALWFAYIYTSSGLRGAFTLVRPLLRH